MTTELEVLVDEFVRTLQIEEWVPPPDLAAAASEAIDGCWPLQMRDPEARCAALFALVNSKLRLNRDRLHAFLDAAAARRVFLNYHEKAALQECFDASDPARLCRLIQRRDQVTDLLSAFQPITEKETLAGLHHQLRTGAVARKDARKCDVLERRVEVLRALFGGYVFLSYSAEAMHRYFNEQCRKKYLPDFYDHLLEFHPEALRRDCSLVFLHIDEKLRRAFAGHELREALFSFIRRTYERLSNHCFFGVLIEPFEEPGESGHWRLFSDLILFAEKHREVALTTGYFHRRQIEAATRAHIGNVDLNAARFEIANEGFWFRDCFVIVPATDDDAVVTTTYVAPRLLLLFEKNQRDETLIPCPACRSKVVAGNSYPILGVRSWECQNPICRERSAFDRGNRYSLSALIKQQAIRSEVDQIPEASLRRWKLDVLADGEEGSVARMLLLHFTLHGDTAVFVNAAPGQVSELGRRVLSEPFAPEREAGIAEQFQGSAYFRRFVVDRQAVQMRTKEEYRFPTPLREVALYQGDCLEVLGLLDGDSVDGAVTSPPYYNARSYTAWPNIYCYLHDMYNAARQVFRVLKPGGLFLFNIFDYFDNENNIVMSAMAKKRMILGAYVVNLCRQVGFKLRGNVVWYKGEIEGKRNFNQGNRSPYYQCPLNCWEHVLVFQKPGPEGDRSALPTILHAKPVVKMVRGKNIHGHSAPFPKEIPDLLLSGMRRGTVVLDPFAGSLTTARTAYARGIKSISIELHRDYCELGVRLLRRDSSQLEFFQEEVRQGDEA